jgi:methionine-gamma-lyase
VSNSKTNSRPEFHPLESLAAMRHEFGEHGGVNMSIEASTTFTVMKAGTLPEMFQGRLGPETGGCYLYGRHFNPTVYVLGRELAALEGTEAAYGTASGMSAITTVVMQCCEPGDKIVAANTLYGGTYALFHDFLPQKAHVETTFLDITDLAAVEAACKRGAKILYVESMSNPTLVVADIPRLAEIAHRHGAKLVVDNTFSPLILSPVKLGADIVVHSVTKFINGASDIIAGAICGSHEFISSLMDLHTGALMLMGPTMDPRVAFEISLRLPHLGIRMAEHSRRALVFSQRLAERGMNVIYPGLPTHPQHALLKSMAHPEFGFGGLLSLDLGTTARAYQFMELLQNNDRFGYIAVSLGYFDTLMSCSASSTSSEMTSEDLQSAGISPGLVRISIGYTGSLEQRWSQLEDALDRLASESATPNRA